MICRGLKKYEEQSVNSIIDVHLRRTSIVNFEASHFTKNTRVCCTYNIIFLRK